MARPTSSRQSIPSTSTTPSTATSTTTVTFETASSSNQQPPQITDSLVLKLKRPKKKVTWKEGTVDNEFMNKKSSKKCCIFHKEKPFDEDDSDAEALVPTLVDRGPPLLIFQRVPPNPVKRTARHSTINDTFVEALLNRKQKVLQFPMEKNESKILIFGGTGYIGSHMVKASIKLGHPTYIFTRPLSDKTVLLNDFESKGAIIVKGGLDEHDKLVSVLREVDVVISVLPYPQRFLPSDFGVEEDRVSVLPPFEAFLDKKKKIRRAIEAANIPHTFVSANCFAAYFVNYLLRPSEQKEEITVYGTGEAKAVLNYEEDIGIFTIKVATDPRTRNRVVIYRPAINIISQLELISMWEKKTGRTFKKVHVPEEEIVTLSQTLPDPHNIPISILHSVFIKGVTTNFDLGENDVEASALYPDLKLTTIDELLNIFLHDPPKSYNAAFE
ncbi:hypothetical protein BUALT_Bualt08G0136500 [Buddleja alternifolia]|uniref:NmrA-like domain-containing protein n=1 Tax=Buddleja alternifolia TaxID=168488 RepID=A0AAV6XGZ8_9LAMI|nr:hypothetical protein BUALT_Bualt08G0136500 [Buddleja alternifolia]